MVVDCPVNKTHGHLTTLPNMKHKAAVRSFVCPWSSQRWPIDWGIPVHIMPLFYVKS